MHSRQLRRQHGKWLTKVLAHRFGNHLPEGTFANGFDVAQHVIEHVMCLLAKTAPVTRVKGGGRR